ncbi:beta-propeller fold lactonase family protein, partial [Mycobacterium sp. B14F4]|uniref:YVTN family beta-propeller repeat protein n=1 Tax=Mycobacterium sp. B14F4 TaxID=3153565 RepID=UPI00325E1CA4
MTVNSDGTFSYTPTVAARLAAQQTNWVDTDAFTVSVSDGTSTVTTTVSVPVSPADLTVSPAVGSTGTNPAGVVVIGNTAYVANQSSASVSVIDLSTSTPTVIKTISVGTKPTTVVASPDQKQIYVTNSWSNSVSIIDTQTNTVVGTIAVGAGPIGAVLSSDGSRLYVANASGNSVSVINTATRTVVTTVRVGAFPTGVALSPDGSRLYVANKNGFTVSVVDTAAAAVIATVRVGMYPSDVAVSGTRAYVTNQNSDSVSVIDANPASTTFNQVIGTITLASKANPTSVVVSADGTLVYVANSDDTISVIDPATNTVIRTVQIDANPETGAHTLSLSADGTRLFVTDAADRALRWVSLVTTAANNQPPVAGTPTVGTPNPTNGAVTGSLNFTDPDGNPLTYTVPTQPSSGTVTITTNGTYTYTPTQAAR